MQLGQKDTTWVKRHSLGNEMQFRHKDAMQNRPEIKTWAKNSNKNMTWEKTYCLGDATLAKRLDYGKKTQLG